WCWELRWGRGWAALAHWRRRPRYLGERAKPSPQSPPDFGRGFGHCEVGPQATPAPSRQELLPLSARWNRPPAPARRVCSPLRGRWRVAPPVRASPAPSHSGALLGSLSFAAAPAARPEPARRRSLVAPFSGTRTHPPPP